MNNQNNLYHHGIKGMHWGQRKADRQAARDAMYKRNEKISKNAEEHTGTYVVNKYMQATVRKKDRITMVKNMQKGKSAGVEIGKAYVKTWSKDFLDEVAVGAAVGVGAYAVSPALAIPVAVLGVYGTAGGKQANRLVNMVRNT